ncbi:MAG TPA: hypothetical protein VMT55_04705 [Candidatus Sulfotelmatobacter sp.]|nr:hypothetical protein [Candidatus Sulfotelmatobacter sp.]
MTKNKHGQVIIAAVFVLVVVSLLGLAAITLLSSESISVVKNYNGLQALNIAEGGLRFTITSSLAADTDWSNNAASFGPITLGPGTFSVVYTSREVSRCSLEVTGTVQGVSRTIAADFVRPSFSLGAFDDYAMYAGTAGSIGDTLYIYDSAKIIGDFYYYGPITIYGHNPPAAQTGGVIKSTSISVPGSPAIPNYYASWETIGSIQNISWSNTYYDTMLSKATGGTGAPTGSVNLTNNTVKYDSVNLYGNYTISGTGTLCTNNDFSIGGSPTSVQVTGNIDLIIGGNLYMHDASYINNRSVEVIVKNKIAMDGTAYASTGAWVYCKAASDDALVLSGNNRIIGGSILIPYGGVTAYNNSYLKGLVYARLFNIYGNSTLEGSSVFKDLGNFYNNSTIIQNGGLLPTSSPTGLSSESVSGTLENTYWYEKY